MNYHNIRIAKMSMNEAFNSILKTEIKKEDQNVNFSHISTLSQK